MLLENRFLSQKNKAILREMVITDFKVRYQGSVLGYMWSVLRPLFLFTILYIVFVRFLRFGSDIPHYSVYLLMGIILWNFFAEATSSAMTSIVARGDLIKKISIPRYLVVVSSALSALINLAFNLVVLLLIAFLNNVPIMKSWLLVPVFIIELFVLSIALGFLLSAVFVRYRDASYVWEVVMQAGFYATPIIYPLAIVPARWHSLIMLNPVAQAIQDARWSFVNHDAVITSWKVLDTPYLYIPFVIILVLIVVATKYFKHESRYFAEKI
jgi:ABC-2 type transport system permease protein